MKVQDQHQLADVAVTDRAGRVIGRVVEIRTDADRFSVTWLVVRVAPWRLRGVPADGVIATLGGLQVPLSRREVLASAPVRRDRGAVVTDWAAIEACYEQRRG